MAQTYSNVDQEALQVLFLLDICEVATWCLPSLADYTDCTEQLLHHDLCAGQVILSISTEQL